MEYNEILDTLMQMETPEDRSRFFVDMGAVLVTAREPLSKPFFSSAPEGAVGLAVEVDDLAHRNYLFAVFPNFSMQPILGLVKRDKLEVTDEPYTHTEQVLKANGYDPNATE